MATYYNLDTFESLEVGDIVIYTGYKSNINAKGTKFHCKISSPAKYSALGVICEADFDFRNVSDGHITFDIFSLCITNGTANSIYYKRIMVAGQPGNEPRYSGSSPYGGDAGLFNSTAGTGGKISGGQPGKGGTQNSGGQKGSYDSYDGSFYSGGSGNDLGGTGGNGWFGGGGGGTGGGGGGGSSYILTSESFKPSGYFLEWPTYAPLISNPISQSTNLTSITNRYVVTILEVSANKRLVSLYDNDQWIDCEIKVYANNEFIDCDFSVYHNDDWN